jgi:F-type H+-transporting ATPase subunit b
VPRFSFETEPKQKANSIIDSLPGNSLVSKTGYITLGTGLATFLISKEVYVFNEETLVLVGAGGLLFGLLKYLREPFTTMGNEHINVSSQKKSRGESWVHSCICFVW